MDQNAQRNLLSHTRFSNASSVALYKSYDGEISTDLIAHHAVLGGKTVLYAACADSGHLRFVDALEWSIGPTGLPVPIGPEHSLSNGALVVVPGVGFDREGYRLGFGGGYYDRTLAALSVFTIGLAYECQMVDRCPRDHWDQPVHALATENNLYEFYSRETKD